MSYPFISIDGLDGTGKTTICKMVVDELVKKMLPVVLIKPGAHPYLPAIKTSMAYGSETTMMLTFLAAMSFASDEVAKNRISKIAISDRYYFSTFAYNWAKNTGTKIHPDFFNFLKPDLAILLTVNEEERLKRVNNREANSSTDFEKVSEGSYFWKVERNLKNFGLIEISTNNQTPAETANLIVEKILGLLNL